MARDRGPTNLVTRVGACQFHVHRWGGADEAAEGAAPPLVALHGFTGDGLDFSALVAHLETPRAVWAPDLIGHGRSDAPGEVDAYAMERCVEQVCAVVEEVAGGPAVWLGYSMGGRVALQVARARPDLVERLILVSATPGLEDAAEAQERRAQDAERATSIERDGALAFLARWGEHPLIATQSRAPEPYLSELRARRRRSRAIGLANSLRGMGTGSMCSLWDELDAIHAPTLLITGGEDAKFDGIARRMLRRLPRAGHAIVAGANHAPQLERPAATAAAVDAFLRG